MDALVKTNVVWFKRDLRLRDHGPLHQAISQKLPLLLIYVVEPINLDDLHMDVRHWRFIWQSLSDLNTQLKQFNTKVIIRFGDVTEVMSSIQRSVNINTIYSHEEIGLKHTFDRDLLFGRWCVDNNVNWIEHSYGAVIRPLSNRLNWRQHWQNRILGKQYETDFDALSSLSLTQVSIDLDKLATEKLFEPPVSWLLTPEHFQLGGEMRAWHTLKHFFKERGKRYFGNIGDPTTSRETCSRLSPYLAWGNVSLKQVYQYSLKYEDREGWKRSIAAFQSRLHWHCHFVQKFESECDIEFRPVNLAYSEFPYVSDDVAEGRLLAWKQGKTGVPIVDACMRAVAATGYLNFRMRAMVVSFLCHHLNVDWQLGVSYLGSQFLDFEPGIHYPQFQMQAGITGTNTIRIYSPIKQSLEKDPEAVFIKKWVPELSSLPAQIIHTPWDIMPLERQMYDFDYPDAIVNIEQAAREARDRLWAYRKRADVRKEAKRVLFRHSVLT